MLMRGDLWPVASQYSTISVKSCGLIQFRQVRLVNFYIRFNLTERPLTFNSGLEALIKKQMYFRSTFMDYTTLATFFSSITATTLIGFVPIHGREYLLGPSSMVVGLPHWSLSVVSATKQFPRRHRPSGS